MSTAIKVLGCLGLRVDISARVSKRMLTWLRNPKVDMELGRTVLQELDARPDLDVHLGLSYTSAALELGVDTCK